MLQICQVLIGHLGKGKGGDIQFSMLDELKEQIERAFINGGMNAIVFGLVRGDLEAHG